jgi:ribosomal protein L12E/L44/L45/RPP1/RPP2
MMLIAFNLSPKLLVNSEIIVHWSSLISSFGGPDNPEVISSAAAAAAAAVWDAMATFFVRGHPEEMEEGKKRKEWEEKGKRREKRGENNDIEIGINEDDDGEQ